MSPGAAGSSGSGELQRLGAEFVGTFFLTLVAAGADILDLTTGAIGHTARYLAPGFLVTAIIWSFSGVSGAHINPAVTFGFVLRGSFPLRKAMGYWIVQFAGAIAAAYVLRGFFGDSVVLGATHPGHAITALAAAIWEALLTALLVLVILSTAQEEAVVGKNAALAVGFTVALCGLFGSPMSGASMNPARSIGPQLAGGDMSSSWIYIVGPLAGAALATLIVFLVLGSPRGSERAAARGSRNKSA